MYPSLLNAVGISILFFVSAAHIIPQRSAICGELSISRTKDELLTRIIKWCSPNDDERAGVEVEVVTPKQPTLLHFIPAFIILNDGLTGDILGESEIELLMYDEEWYSKLSNADNDAQRKSMNPTKYTVDMESNSTKNLSTAAGSYWDLGSDQNLENPKPMVGLLEPNMSYSESLKTTLDRIKTSAYETVDVPNVTNESLSGVITSGKALKAIYWPLIIRCKEKMKVWGPALMSMVDIIIKGASIYPKCADRYIEDHHAASNT